MAAVEEEAAEEKCELQPVMGWLAAATNVLLQLLEGAGDVIFNDSGRGIGGECIESRTRKIHDDSAMLTNTGPSGCRWPIWLAPAITMLQEVDDGGAEIGDGGGGRPGNDEAKSARSGCLGDSRRVVSTTTGPSGWRGSSGCRGL